MSTILLSIKPEYTNRILAGSLQKDFTGISHEKYMEYFSQKEFAYAYQLGEVKKFKKAKDLSEYGISAAPQSFVYIES